MLLREMRFLEEIVIFNKNRFVNLHAALLFLDFLVGKPAETVPCSSLAYRKVITSEGRQADKSSGYLSGYSFCGNSNILQM